MLTATNYSDATPDDSQTYDNFGRPVEVKNGASEVVGGVFTIANPLSSTTYAYDPASLLLDTETVSHDINTDGTPELTRVIDRKFDAIRRSTGFSLSGTTPATGVGGGAPPQPDSATSYAYNPTTGRLESVSNPLSPGQVFTYGYEPNSNLLKTVTSPAHTVTNSYDPTRNVLLNKENKAGASIVSNYAYDVNAIGQRTDVSQSGTAFATARDIAWGYDPLGQVTKADSTIPGLDRSYQYDLIGNRLKASDSLALPATPNYTTNSLNQYSAIQNQQSSIINPAYDADGNATAYPLPAQPSANSTLTWDAENRLTSATLPDSTTVTYTYDSTSRRIAKTTATGTTLYLYDAWNLIAEYIGSAGVSPTLSKTYLWGMDLSGSMQGAGGVGGLLMVSEISNSQIPNYFPTYDANGNVSDYLDPTGAIAAHYEYDPFGNTTVATGPNATAFTHRFSTKHLETETGLYYYGYRFYDPATGRWPSRDPIEERGGINLYGFVGNDGTNYFDVLGLDGGVDYSMALDAQLALALKHFGASDEEAVESGRRLAKMAKEHERKHGSDALPGLTPEEFIRYECLKEKFLAGEITQEEYFRRLVNDPGMFDQATGELKSSIINNLLTMGGLSLPIKVGKGPVPKTRVSGTKTGDPRIKQEFPDGRKTDITDKRVKEFKPNNHPDAPPGSMDKVKFDNAQPGSKGFKRDPTPAEVRELDKLR